MVLPESAAYVLEKLENAGFEAYVVGGLRARCAAGAGAEGL